MKNIISITISALILTLPAMALAQIPGFGNLSVNLRITPEFPEPGQEMRASVSTFTFDIDRANIEWSLNGKVISRGAGVKEVTFNIGSLGSASTLKVTALPNEGGSVEKTIEIRPHAIDLLVESQSFRPSWYKGASLITSRSKVKITALPHFIFEGSRLDPKNLIYEWSLDDRARGDISGKGKQSITITAAPTENSFIAVYVKISSPLGTLVSEASTIVQTARPEVLFYEEKPLEGLIMSEALQLKTITGGSELQVQAVPFFMNFTALSDLTFNWNFGQENAKPDSRRSSVLLLKSNEGSFGETNIRVVINNAKNILEEITSSFNLYVR